MDQNRGGDFADPMRGLSTKLGIFAGGFAYIVLWRTLGGITHVESNGEHVFHYTAASIAVAAVGPLIPGALAVRSSRKGDRGSAVLWALAMLLFAYITLPDALTDRVRVTPTRLIHYRELLSSRVDVDVPFADIAGAYEIDRQDLNDGSHSIGYVVHLKDGRALDVPTNEMLTAARPLIRAQLESAQLPYQVVRVTQDQQQKAEVNRLLRTPFR